MRRYALFAVILVSTTSAAAQPAAGPTSTPVTPAPAAPATPAAAAPPPAETAPAASDPAPEVQAEYREVVARAVAEFDAGRWAEARALFLRAHELWPSARTYRTLGMTSFELRAYAQALTELEAALSDARRPIEADQRAQVSTLADQARAFVGQYRVQVSPAEAELLVDGAPRALAADGLLRLEVGQHELRARAPGYSELTRRLDVRGREDESLTLSLSAAAAPSAAQPTATPAPAAQTAQVDAASEPARGGRLFTWIAGGTAVALAGTSLALWLISDSKFDEQLEDCQAMAAKGCEPDSVDTSGIEDTETAHQVTAVLAGVVGAAAVALFFIEDDGEESPRVSIGPGGVVASGRF